MIMLCLVSMNQQLACNTFHTYFRSKESGMLQFMFIAYTYHTNVIVGVTQKFLLLGDKQT